MDKFLLHYTSFLNCISILSSGKIYFGNILYSNDNYERSNAEDPLDDGYFVFCTTNVFSSLMRLAYSKGDFGAALKFYFKKDKKEENMFCSKEYKISFEAIKYVDDYYELIGDNLNLIGKIKDADFRNENEYRFLIRLDSKDMNKDERFIKVPINFDAIEKIDLIINPKLYEICKMMEVPLKQKVKVPLNIVLEKSLIIK